MLFKKIFLKTKFAAISAIDEDYKAIGKCDLALAGHIETIPGSFAWALPKKSPYTRLFTKGYNNTIKTIILYDEN